MSERNVLHSMSPEVGAFLKAIGAPEHITEFRLVLKVNEPVMVECKFYMTFPKGDEGALLITKKYKLVELE